MFRKLFRKSGSFSFKMTMKIKLSLGLGAIAAILLLSSVISVVEYGRMSSYVSSLIATDIYCINTTQKVAEACDDYNLRILASIGEGKVDNLPYFDEVSFMETFKKLKNSFSSREYLQAADSVIDAYSDFLLRSSDFEVVMLSEIIDTRQWYFEQLQPVYKKFKNSVETLSNLIYRDLRENSESFQDGFYRSIMPGVVSVGAGLLLVILLLFFLISYYVNPVYRMLAGIENYMKFGKRYNCTFDGDDELVAINEGVSEIIEENIEVKKRLAKLREEREKFIETSGEGVMQ